MTTAADATWDAFLGDAALEVARLADATRGAAPALGELRALAGGQFSVRAAAALLGIEPLVRLCAAIENALYDAAAGATWTELQPPLAACARTLGAALESLGRPDASGARLDDTALLDTAIADLVALRAEPLEAPAEAEPPPAPSDDDALWAPQVDADMIEPFLEEAAERIEGLSQKLLRIESSPDGELVRDLFRDLHTLKGSSAFVGLRRMNQLAHAAEDLVGQLRDGVRPVDRNVVDALLGALDGLRAILEAATRASGRAGAVRIDVDVSPWVARLRAPGAPTVPGDTPMPSAAAPPPSDGKHTLRVDFEKLDVLLNLVGELVLAKARLHGNIAGLAAFAREFDAEVRRARAHRGRGRLELEDLDRFARILAALGVDLQDGAGTVDHVADDLRLQVMKLRMLPIARVFTKYGRTVRELSNSLGKRVRLELVGAETELDKVLVEQLDEPLLHLVRNAVDHGIEPPEVRLAAGKPAEGVVQLAARHQGNQIVVEISDDGAGIEPAKLRKKALASRLATPEELDAMDERGVLDLIFRPGFSTAARVTDISGRGVGMDVVRATITRMSGSIEISSVPGQGTSFTLKLPLTLAILQVLLVRAAGEDFALPLDVVVRTLAVARTRIARLADRQVLILDDGTQLPLIGLADALELTQRSVVEDELPIVVVNADGELYGLMVERLIGKRETVQKTLGELLAEVPCAAGATLIDDRVALVLDVVQVVQRGLQRGAAPPAPPTAAPPTAARQRPRVLVVEDSEVAREGLRRLYEAQGCEVVAARDGAEALQLADGDDAHFDLVSTDVMMPRVDGYELTRALRQRPRHKDVPIVMVTSRSDQIDRVRGFDAGVDEYLTKPLDAGELVRALDRYLKGRS